MRPRVNVVLVSLILLVLPAFMQGSPSAIGDGAERSARRQESVSAFPGFEPGKEVRYVLEGEDGLARALESVWSMRLTGVEESGVGVFELNHRFGGVGPGYAGTGGPGTGARAWIDPHGFPLRVEITQGWGSAGSDTVGYVIEYRFRGDEYVKELRADQFHERQGMDLPEHPGVDAGVPRGLYLFMPVGADCLVAAVTARTSSVQAGAPGAGPAGSGGPGGGGGAGAAAGDQDADPPCRGREIVFANPGLLSLTMPALWETGTGEHEFALLAPTGLDPAALARGGRNSRGTNFSVGGLPLGDLLFGPDVFGDPEHAFGTFRLTADGGLVDLELGGFTESAFRFNTPDPVAAVWVDGWGGIVRVDLAPASEREARLWIRRLRASEY